MYLEKPGAPSVAELEEKGASEAAAVKQLNEQGEALAVEKELRARAERSEEAERAERTGACAQLMAQTQAHEVNMQKAREEAKGELEVAEARVAELAASLEESAGVKREADERNVTLESEVKSLRAMLEHCPKLAVVMKGKNEGRPSSKANGKAGGGKAGGGGKKSPKKVKLADPFEEALAREEEMRGQLPPEIEVALRIVVVGSDRSCMSYVLRVCIAPSTWPAIPPAPREVAPLLADMLRYWGDQVMPPRPSSRGPNGAPSSLIPPPERAPLRRACAASVFNLAQCYRKRRRFEDAARAFGVALSLEPGDAAARGALGVALHALGGAHVHRAVECYHVALAMRPDDTFCSEMLSRALRDVASVDFDDAALLAEHRLAAARIDDDDDAAMA